MGEVHANWGQSQRGGRGGRARRPLRTDIDTRAHKLAELLGGIDLGACSRTKRSAQRLALPACTATRTDRGNDRGLQRGKRSDQDDEQEGGEGRTLRWNLVSSLTLGASAVLSCANHSMRDLMADMVRREGLRMDSRVAAKGVFAEQRAVAGYIWGRKSWRPKSKSELERIGWQELLIDWGETGTVSCPGAYERATPTIAQDLRANTRTIRAPGGHRCVPKPYRIRSQTRFGLCTLPTASNAARLVRAPNSPLRPRHARPGPFEAARRRSYLI